MYPKTTPAFEEAEPQSGLAVIEPTGQPDVDSSTLMSAVKLYLPPADWTVVERGVQFAIQAHSGQRRASGEPYVIHPIAAATTCATLQLDRDTLVAALLHDVPEDTAVTLEQVQQEFGDKVARLVDGVTKLGKIKWTPVDDQSSRVMQEKQEQAENLRKMFLAMVDDVRVVLIKLADRLHNMQTLQFKSPAKQIKIATETLEIFAPLANRLGIWSIKWHLEDLCFQYLYPTEHQELVNSIDDKKEQESRERYLKRVQEVIRERLLEAGITPVEISGRPKHFYSIFKKMKRKNVPIDQIYDALGVRIIVEDVRDCYGALGIIHTLWRPIPGEFDDYIANPKESMYQSLHTAVIALDTRPLEVQIRTKEMHQVAEYGIAAHWRYKEGGKRDVEFEAKIAWLRRLLDWKDDNYDAQDFVDSLKSDVFQDQVYVFTPKGDIIDLPAGATPIDFAYRIHTDIGHQCGRSRVNDRLVPLDYQLQNGEVVKITLDKNRKGPSRDWLNANLGYLKTAGARDKVKQWFRREERDENIAHGRQNLEAEMKRLGLSNIKYEAVASYFSKYDKLDDFLAAIGYGGISMGQITGRLLDITRQNGNTNSTLPEFMQPSSVSLSPGSERSTVTSEGLTVAGVGGMLTSIANCCHPMKGDQVIGYVTRTKGIAVHRADCPNVSNVSDENKGRLLPVDWSNLQQYYRVPVRMEALDRVGLLRDIATLCADEKINMGEFRTLQAQQRGVILILFNVEVTGLEQLARVLNKLHTVRDVLDVHREVPNATATQKKA